MHVEVREGWEPTPLAGGRWMLSPMGVVFESYDDLVVTLELTVQDGVPTCEAYTVRVPGGGLERMTTDVARGIKLRELLEMGAAHCAIGAPSTSDGVTTADYTFNKERVAAVGRMTRRRRQPVTDESLRRFAEAYKQNFRRGHMAEFAKSLDYGERHVWRLRKLAIERGFLTEGED
jgi:hypothetical protein